MDQDGIIVVGAGLAGLCCALRLREHGLRPIVLEASDGVGGRVRTDFVDGFRLDRGFQVLLTAYPLAQQMLDYPALELHPLYPGALVRVGGKFHKLADPWRHPIDGIRTAVGGVGTIGDKLKVGRLRSGVQQGAVDELFRQPERATVELLRHEGISEQMIDQFFRPFFGGVFFDRDLQTSSRMFAFCFRMFAAGDTALPAAGMGAIAEQLAARLPAGTIRLHASVSRVEPGKVALSTGEEVRGRAVVVATEAPRAASLLGIHVPAPRAVTCMYFAAARAPIVEPILVLNGEGAGPVNNLAVLSEVSRSYAPAGQSLVSVTVLGNPDRNDEQLEASVRDQLTTWFGRDVSAWRYLRTYRIPYALPAQFPPALEPPQRPVRLRQGVYVCGDHRDNASINGAMESGLRAADAVWGELGP